MIILWILILWLALSIGALMPRLYHFALWIWQELRISGRVLWR